MIDAATRQKICDLTREYWAVEVATEAFAKLAAGKEIGHRIADLVDETTTALIEKNFSTARQCNRRGIPMPRSMGDIWLLSNGIYNPINVKAGEANKNGQPNMMSLNKLVNALLDHEIDAYYLLLVKMTFQSGSITPTVYLVDILDYLDHVTFDSGPGQLMLKERQFYEAIRDNIAPPSSTLEQNIDRLLKLRKDAYQRLIRNRAKGLAILERKRAASTAVSHTIDQTRLNLR